MALIRLQREQKHKEDVHQIGMLSFGQKSIEMVETGTTYEERAIRLRCEAGLPQTQVAIAVGDAEFVAVLREPAPRHLGKGAGRPRCAHHLLMVPLPHLHRSILATG